MSPQLQRALLLFQQSRFDLAESELRQALALEPDDAYAHALLALCLAHREKFPEATEEARQAVHLAPDFAYAHYAMAHVWRDRARLDEALVAANEALRLDPDNADYFALLSQLGLDRRDWPAALDAAERGLQHDPEHIGCTNLRAIALVKLGRRSEAGLTIDAALARNPDNALTHANQGWTLLEKGEPKKALEHFREALRIDPDHEWARAGIVEALKARNIIYGVMLRYFLWMSRLSGRAQWIVIFGVYLLGRMLATVAEQNPQVAHLILPLRILLFTAVLLTWTADPMFNLFLRMNRFGRLALTPEQTRASSWFGIVLALGLVSLALWAVSGFKFVFLMGALVFGFLLIPVSAIFKAHPGWPRMALGAYTALVAAAGLAALALFGLGDEHGSPEARQLHEHGMGALTAFLIGVVLFMWGANLVLRFRLKR